MRARLLLLAWMLTILVCGGALHADTDLLVERMKSRLPGVVKLKITRQVHENAEGYLTVHGRAGLAPAEAELVAAENEDRRRLYAAVAARVAPPLTPERVGQLRARLGKPVARPADPLLPGRLLFSLHGSNTVGAELGPVLAAGFLRTRGARDLIRLPGDTRVESRVYGTLPGEGPVEVFVAGHGSGTAFPALARGLAQVGMASRPIKDEEVELLEAQGAMRSPACEVVIALDALPVFVHPENPVDELSVEQLRDIFTGRINRWSEVGGPDRAIHRYSRDEKSGTRDTFDSLVLDGRLLARGTREFEDSAALSDAVAEDPGAIGYAGVAYPGRCKVLAISAGPGLDALVPSRSQVAKEQYALSRRLYLYAPEDRPAVVSDFLSWVASDEGQAVVEQAGFIPLSLPPKLAPPQRIVTGHREFDELTSKGEQVPLVFRFRPGTFELDSKSVSDVDRLVRHLQARAEPAAPRDVILIGFSEAGPGGEFDDAAIEASRRRARVVADLLARAGLSPAVVRGLGGVLPIAGNATEAGRRRNQRVEVFLVDRLL